MGYSLVVFFSLLAFLSLSEFIVTNSKKYLIAFYIAVLFGFLSHVIFTYVFIGLFGMAAYFYILHSNLNKFGDKIITLLRIFSLPLLIFAIIYFRFISKSSFMFGTSLSFMQTVSQSAAYLMGLPWQMPYLSLIAAIVYVILVTKFFFPFKRERSLVFS